jgi:hypothetical protein
MQVCALVCAGNAPFSKCLFIAVLLFGVVLRTMVPKANLSFGQFSLCYPPSTSIQLTLNPPDLPRVLSRGEIWRLLTCHIGFQRYRSFTACSLICPTAQKLSTDAAWAYFALSISTAGAPGIPGAAHACLYARCISHTFVGHLQMGPRKFSSFLAFSLFLNTSIQAALCLTIDGLVPSPGPFAIIYALFPFFYGTRQMKEWGVVTSSLQNVFRTCIQASPYEE